jgi:hypothetical protein
LDVEPTPTIPRKIYYVERRTGVGTRAGDEIRAFHRERVEGRKQGKEALELVLRRQREQTRARLAEYASQQADRPKRRLSPQEERERGIERQREWRSANRETYNQKRREQYREKVAAGGAEYERQRDALRRRERERYRANIEANRARKRENYANRTHGQEKAGASIVEQRDAVAKGAAISSEQLPPSPTAEQSARNWLEYRKQVQPVTAEESARQWFEEYGKQVHRVTAEESARNWLEEYGRQVHRVTAEESARNWLEEYGKQVQPVTAGESARNWAAYRERQLAEEALQSHSGQMASRDVGDKREEETSRGLDYDVEL